MNKTNLGLVHRSGEKMKATPKGKFEVNLVEALCKLDS